MTRQQFIGGATATTGDGAVIVYTCAEWEAFTAGVRLGEFDFPTD